MTILKPLENGFTFKNPNETARCGCGESSVFPGLQCYDPRNVPNPIS